MVSKVCIVTGATSGVGLMTALGLAQSGAHIFLACRSQAKAKRAIAFISKKSGNSKVEYLPLDLASLNSVRLCVSSFKDRNLPLHVLVNNAGIFFGKGLTNEGLNPVFSVNYIGHFLLTYLLLDKLQQADSARIVMVSSDMAYQVHSIDWGLIVTSMPNQSALSTLIKTRDVYSFSKFCMVLIMPEFIKRLQDQSVTINAVHPGFVQSNISIFHRISKGLGIGISAFEGAKSSLFCAMASDLGQVNGKFFGRRCQEMQLPELAKNEDLSRELWQRSLGFLQE
jgi:NAD(P)-dependent dehydrogenase (short-subunit alcohol dehydrogenase family)